LATVLVAGTMILLCAVDRLPPAAEL